MSHYKVTTDLDYQEWADTLSGALVIARRLRDAGTHTKVQLWAVGGLSRDKRATKTDTLVAAWSLGPRGWVRA